MTSVVDTPDAVLDDVPDGLLIAGRRRARARARFAVANPSTGEEIAHVVEATVEDAEEALAAAYDAGPAWSLRPPRERADLLMHLRTLILEHRDPLAALIALEMGKPLAEAHAEVTYAADFVRWFAEEAQRLEGKLLPSPDGGSTILTSHRPVGPCLMITPWNFPLAMATRKLAPALAAGCTAVIKPAELTPLTTLYLGQLIVDAGVPDGVVNIVTTSDPGRVVQPLLGHHLARKVSFTGSTAVGMLLTELAARQLLRVSMELGGNAPLIVFDDADLDVAVDGAVLAKLRNNGQSCIAANRLLVHDGIADEFLERFVERMSTATVGAATAPGTVVGPLIDQRAVEFADEIVRDAESCGATVVTGGRPGEGPGYFYPPTVLDNVPAHARAVREEIFAPVAPIMRFTDEAEALQQANATEHGLVAYAFTTDLNRVARVNRALETGMVGINQGVVSNVAAPFGGVKHSGLGREGGHEGILEYTELQYTAIAGP